MPSLPKPKRQAYRPERKRKPTGDQRFYNSSAWRKTSRLTRQRNPLCEVCKANGKVVASVLVDHLIARRYGGADFNPANLMAMCSHHHDVKSGKETNGLPLEAKQAVDGLIPYDRIEVFMLVE